MSNMKYTKRSKRNNDVKEAIWKAYGKYCPICKQYLPLAELTIDRIIPEDQSALSSETLEYYDRLCKDGFMINCLENYMPMHGRENIEKGNKDLGVYQFQHRLLTAKSKVKAILVNLQEKKIRKRKDTLIYQLGNLVGNDDSEAEFIYNYITKQNNEFEVKRDILDGYRHYHCTFAEKNVALFFNIPKTIEEGASCLLTFTSLRISACLITINQNQINEVLFSSVKTSPTKASRKFILFPDRHNNEEYFVQLGNNRFTLKIQELEQLCNIIDDLYDEYIKVFENIENAMGTTEFEYDSDVKGYKLLKMSKQLWNLLFRYSWKYDWDNGNDDRYIFNKTGTQIQINSPFSNKNFRGGIHSVLHPVEDIHSIVIYWKEGFSSYYEDNTLNIYNQDQKWKCDYTYEWLMDTFIPNALYEEYLDNLNIGARLLQKKLNFLEFKNKINYKRLGIYRSIPSVSKLKTLDDKRDLLSYFGNIEILIRNSGKYIYFEYGEIISLLNTCNIVIASFKSKSHNLKPEWSYFNISEYMDAVNRMYNMVEANKQGEEFEECKICSLLKDVCRILSLDFINISEDILSDIKLELVQFNEAIRKILLIVKYK